MMTPEDEQDTDFTVRFRRITKGLSVAQLARILEMTEGAARKIVNGKTQTIELHRAYALCKRVGASLYDLAGAEEGAATRLARETVARHSPPDSELSRIRDDIRILAEEVRALNLRLASLLDARTASAPASHSNAAPKRDRQSRK